MQNFEFYAPTKILFGSGVLKDIGGEARKLGTKALLVYGQRSIKESGLYSRLLELLKNADITVTEHSGVKPNPVISHALEGKDKAKAADVDMIIGVGGGSVIDESKAIAAGACYAGNLWDFYDQTEEIKDALPIIAVQTLPATSSEMNQVSVLTRPETNEKFGVRSPLIVPAVSFLDPELTLTLPLEYTAYASFDIMSHLLEGYFTSTDKFAPVQDGFVEGMVKAVMTSLDIVLEDSTNTEARSALMWAGALAWNGLCNAGVEGAETPNHMLEHPLSAVYDIPHGAGLSAIFPSWLRYKKNSISSRIIQFGKNILMMGSEIEGMSEDSACNLIIDRFSSWIGHTGCPLNLREAGISNPDNSELIKQARIICGQWGIKNYTDEDLEAIYRMAL